MDLREKGPGRGPIGGRWGLVVGALGAFSFFSSVARAAEPDGPYVSGVVAPVFGLGSTHQWATDCPVIEPSAEVRAQFEQAGTPLPFESWTPAGCGASAPLGVALEGRIGVRFQHIGLEGFLLGSGDWTSGSLEGTPPIELPSYATKMQIGRVGAGPGLGLRLMPTKLRSNLLVSLGVGGGAMIRYVYTNISSLDGSADTYIAPMVRVDAGIVLFRFLALGVMGWAEFADNVRVLPNLEAVASSFGAASNVQAYLTGIDGVTVFQGTQFFVGPYLGLHFGP